MSPAGVTPGWWPAALVLLGTALTACDPPEGGEPTQSPVVRTGDIPSVPCPARGEVTGPFVTRRGSQLLLDGRPWQAVGGNVYYLQQLLAYAEQGNPALGMPALEALEHMNCLGMSVVRAWAFNDSQDSSSIRTSPGVYREEGLRGLDRAVAEARRRGLRVILTLVNNWRDYGGLPRYAEWAGRAGGDEFFTDSVMQGYWRDYVTMLANRVNTFTGIPYREEPAILAWEIGNELRCRSCRGTSRYLETVRALARHLKVAFPNHLVADGGDGHDDAPASYPGLSNTYSVRGDEGVSFSGLLDVDELDMLSYHLYPTAWGLDDRRDADIWINAHQRLAAAAGKVAYLGEFGQETTSFEMRDQVRAPVFERWLGRLLERDHGALGLLWQVIPQSRLGAEDDGFGVVYQADAATTRVLRHWSTYGQPASPSRDEQAADTIRLATGR